PRHAEDDLALRLADTLDQRIVGIIRMLGDHAAEALQNFADRLVEFILTRVALQDFGQDRLELLVNLHHATSQYSYGGGVVGEANAHALETTPSRDNTEKRVSRPAFDTSKKVAGSIKRNGSFSHPPASRKQTGGPDLLLEQWPPYGCGLAAGSGVGFRGVAVLRGLS